MFDAISSLRPVIVFMLMLALFTCKCNGSIRFQASSMVVNRRAVHSSPHLDTYFLNTKDLAWVAQVCGFI